MGHRIEHGLRHNLEHNHLVENVEKLGFSRELYEKMWQLRYALDFESASDVQKLTKKNQGSYRDFYARNLLALAESNIAYLLKFRVPRASTQGVYLSNALLKNRDFKKTSLYAFDLSGQDLTDSDFSGAQLSFAFFNKTNLTRTKFNSAVVSEAAFIDAIFNETDFTDAFMMGANLGVDATIKLNHSNFSGANLVSASYLSDNQEPTLITISWLIKKGARFFEPPKLSKNTAVLKKSDTEKEEEQTSK